jgi:periplasmic divalent cation tolerance protein
MNGTHPFVVMTTTAETREVLEPIASELLKRKLAACCQISGPVTSIYRWKEQIESSQEFVCTIKTVATLVHQVTQLVQNMHPYDEPELIVTPIVGGSETYLQWIAANCDDSKN